MMYRIEDVLKSVHFNGGINVEEKLMKKLGSGSLDFESFFSEKALGMKASEVRELLKLVESSDVISLAGGLPAPETFPVDVIEQIAVDVLENHADKALQYGTTKGFTPLRLALARWMEKRYGIPMSKVEIMIVAGSQQALDLIGRTFVNPGDIIIVEAPTYLAAIQAFKYYDPEMIGIPMDDEGMRVDVLEEKLEELRRKGKRVKLVYTVSTFQNPAGVTMSLRRRKKLIELASEYNFLVVEDGPTVTHGGMAFGAGLVAARQCGVTRLVDPRAHAVGSIAGTFAGNPHLERVLPAMGYSQQQRSDLKATIEASGAEVVLDASPADIGTLLDLSIPVVRVSYHWKQRHGPDLLEELRALAIRSATSDGVPTRS